MALKFDDDELEEELEELEEKNCYLDDSDKGIGLIKSMLLKETKKGEYDKFEKIIFGEIFPILAELEWESELEIYRRLSKINDKLKEQNKISMIEGKKILGVGGKFSSGKSSFINSITTAHLPEGQRPTTSIATYIIGTGHKKNIAVSTNNNIIDLDDEAVEALTHKFYEKYKIGFSRLIKNLVICTADFTYPNVAILDTPGYSKSDDDKKSEYSDASVAKEQLKASDYLIWLVDSVQGVITEKDIEFISSLNMSNKILFVFTKADLETPENLNKKLKKAREILKSSFNDKVYNIIAYNSYEGKTVIGGGVLESFLNKINHDKASVNEIENEVNELQKQIFSYISQQVEKRNQKMKEYENVLLNTSNVEHIGAVVEDYRKCIYERNKLVNFKNRISSSFNELSKAIAK